MDSEIKTLKIALLLSGLMLCIAVIPGLPDIYLLCVRIVVCASSAFAAVFFNRTESFKAHFAILAILTTLFNPIIPVHLTQALWILINLSTAVYFSTLVKKI